MNLALWILQAITALLYFSSGVMKTFLFDKISVGVPSFGALPKNVWGALGVLEILCALGLILPGVLRWNPPLTVYAATLLALESLIFIGVHIKYREPGTIALSAALGIIMAFIAYGRHALAPIS